nr:flagellar hook-basal body protein [Campylobacter sp.]
MQNGYYQTTGAMVTQFNRLDVITNNLANLNTAGYKRQDVVIADFERIFKETRDILPLRNHTRDAAKFVNRTIDRVPNINDVYTDFGAGGMKMTNNSLDIALTKDNSFLLVDTPQGVMLTKNGALSLDEDGFLVTKDGYRILSSDYATQDANQRGIQIPQNVQLTIDQDGNVYADEAQISRLFVAGVKELKDLQRQGDNLFRLENLDDMRDLPNSSSIAQGYIQISNVNAVREMVNLIETNRLVGTYQKVMATHMNELNQEAISKLAQVRV